MTEPSHPASGSSGIRESRASFWVTFLAVVGCFAIFVIVLELAYIPQRRLAPDVDLTKIPPEEQWKFTPAGRQAHLDEMRAKEQAAATSYAWIDKDKRIVQLPLDRAMELTLQDINAARKR
jgi:hypothetical protein